MKATLFILVGLLAWTVSARVGGEIDSSRPAPVIEKRARVKQHRVIGKAGELIEGIEHLRKLKFLWNDVEGATGYDVCINCKITGGKRADNDAAGEVIEAQDRCADNPCYIHGELAQGETQVYHVRASFKDGTMTPWSEPSRFTPNEVGFSEHEEL